MSTQIATMSSKRKSSDVNECVDISHKDAHAHMKYIFSQWNEFKKELYMNVDVDNADDGLDGPARKRLKTEYGYVSVY